MIPYRKDNWRAAATRAAGSGSPPAGTPSVARRPGHGLRGVALDEYTAAETLDGFDAVEWLAAGDVVQRQGRDVGDQLGVTYPLFHNSSLNMAVSLLWIVGITNAFNLLDNMDGLAAGVALISALYLAYFYASSGSRENAILVILIAGAVAGFLIFNLNPARIFMGDCGSLFIGFLLGTSSQLEVTHVVGVPAFALAPVVVLAIPIFDTFFVSVTRRLRGQAVSRAGPTIVRTPGAARLE